MKHTISTLKNDLSNAVEAEFSIGGKCFEIFFRSNGDTPLSGTSEALIASALLPAMRAGGGPLVSQGEISQKFLCGLARIQDIYCQWKTSLRRVVVENIVPVPQVNPAANRVGVFFSGGVDSFYSLLKHRDEITDLIFIHGADIPLDNTLFRKAVSQRLRDVAASFDKNVIEIETNIRELLDPYVNWAFVSHGAALASIGHLLTPYFRRIYIAASHTCPDFSPWGSHPDLDPLWSSDTLEFIHDGFEVTRVDKVGFITKFDTALQHLRVCNNKSLSAYNCGTCEKCIRTMINLKVHNALNKCPAFGRELELKNILKMDAHDENIRVLIRENLDALEKSHGDMELIGALRKVLDKPVWPYKLKKRLKTIRKKLKKRF